MSEALVEVRGVGMSFRGRGAARRAPPTQALRDVDLAIAPGEAVGLVGESGSGKSTLARVVLGLLQPTEGRVLFRGRDLAELGAEERAEMRRSVQPVFQDPAASLDPRMKIGALVREPLDVHRLGDRRTRDARVREVLEQVGLSTSMVDRYAHELSGGQRQRVAIARALAPRPKLLVADEPVSALDVSVQAQILNLFRDLGRSLGLAYLFVAHDLAAVDFLCDRVVVLYQGRIVEILPRDGLVADATHPYTKLLVSSVRSLRSPELSAPEPGSPGPISDRG